MNKYFGIFSDRESVRREFGAAEGGFPSDDEILLASYEYEDYSGDAFVLFERNGVLYEVHGGHCSCYGLEDQWEPEETTWEALALRESGVYGGTGEDIALLKQLVAERA
jgi:hypothetical protein